MSRACGLEVEGGKLVAKLPRHFSFKSSGLEAVEAVIHRFESTCTNWGVGRGGERWREVVGRRGGEEGGEEGWGRRGGGGGGVRRGGEEGWGGGVGRRGVRRGGEEGWRRGEEGGGGEEEGWGGEVGKSDGEPSAAVGGAIVQQASPSASRKLSPRGAYALAFSTHLILTSPAIPPPVAAEAETTTALMDTRDTRMGLHVLHSAPQL